MLLLSFLESILFSFIKQIRLGGSQIDNFGTSITILFLLDTFSTIIRIRNTHSTTNTTSTFEGTIIAFITDMRQHGRVYKGITNDTFAVAYKNIIKREYIKCEWEARWCVEKEMIQTSMNHKHQSCRRRSVSIQQQNDAMNHLHFSQRRPIATPGCFRHITRSGWCLAMVIYDRERRYMIDWDASSSYHHQGAIINWVEWVKSSLRPGGGQAWISRRTTFSTALRNHRVFVTPQVR